MKIPHVNTDMSFYNFIINIILEKSPRNEIMVSTENNPTWTSQCAPT